MKRGIIILTALSLILGGCGVTGKTKSNGTDTDISKEIYYSTTGYHAVLSENYLLLTGDKGVQIVNLDTKEIIRESMQPSSYLGDYAMDGTRIVYSNYSNKKDEGKDPFYEETANTDIYLYDITDDTTVQITTNTAGQLCPDIWGDYIVWMDNRNDSVFNNNAEWDIYLYQISTKQETLITTAAGIHTNPKINDGKVVWEDGRNFQGEDYLRGGSNVPENNTDIYMYDIKTGEETAIATGSLQECSPFVSGDYVVWEDRNDGDLAADIYLYNIASNEKIRITDDKVDQRTPRIYGNYLVWMDERNGISTNDVIINGKLPNSDIFLYNIDSKEEYLVSGEEPQVMPDISENYIAFITSRQVNPEINVIKYREDNQQIDVNYGTEGKIIIY